MRVCVLNEDEAWRVECGEVKPDCRFHWHWTATKAIDEIAADRARPARRNGDPNEVVIPDTVVLLPAKREQPKSKGPLKSPLRPIFSAGYMVIQFDTKLWKEDL